MLANSCRGHYCMDDIYAETLRIKLIKLRELDILTNTGFYQRCDRVQLCEIFAIVCVYLDAVDLLRFSSCSKVTYAAVSLHFRQWLYSIPSIRRVVPSNFNFWSDTLLYFLKGILLLRPVSRYKSPMIAKEIEKSTSLLKLDWRQAQYVLATTFDTVDLSRIKTANFNQPFNFKRSDPSYPTDMVSNKCIPLSEYMRDLSLRITEHLPHDQDLVTLSSRYVTKRLGLTLLFKFLFSLGSSCSKMRQPVEEIGGAVRCFRVQMLRRLDWMIEHRVWLGVRVGTNATGMCFFWVADNFRLDLDG